MTALCFPQVQGLNSQWQKYDSSREDYIRGLCLRLKETTGPGLMPGLGSVGSGLLHTEISRLNGLLEDKMRECASLRIEVEDTRRQTRERVQTLEQQVGATAFRGTKFNRWIPVKRRWIHVICFS